MKPSRSWATKYRGPIAIHAAKRPVRQTIDALVADRGDALVDSFNPKQKKWFEEYQKMVTDELWLAEQRRFVCGFKTAMRLALESMK